MKPAAIGCLLEAFPTAVVLKNGVTKEKLVG
jgi:hypothetical protein